jgi:uncharacterized protein involved in outer membrane biogenesis
MARHLPCGRVNRPLPLRRPLLLRSRAAQIALVLLTAIVVLALTFDWNWFGPLVRHYVMSHSGRSMHFDRMEVRFEHGLDPTIEFRNLVIQNAPWAATSAPFIRAGRIAGNISWRSIGSGLIVVNRIDLEDAEVDMERQADGLRNWRLSHPEDRGPARARVVLLDARRSRLHLIHRGIGLELDASSVPLAAPQPFEHRPDLPLTKLMSVRGRLRDDDFDGSARVSDVLAFGGTPRMFSFRLQVASGALRLEASGLTNDLHALGDLDCEARLSAVGTGDPSPLPPALGRLRPLVAQGRILKTGDHWNLPGLRLQAGRRNALLADVDFTGNAKTDTPRRVLKATLRDAVIDLDDVALLRGAKTRPGSDHALSMQPLPLARLRELDADIDLRPVRFVGSDIGLAQSLAAHATLSNGVLDIESIVAGVADGQVTGTLHIDASRTPADVGLALAAKGLRIARLAPKLAADGALIGALDGSVAVKTRGDSQRALAANANGTVTLSLAPGASVSQRMDAKLGLDGGEWLRTLFDKSARTPVQCATVTLALSNGVATSRRFVFETPQTALAARGSLALADQTLDLTLTPAHKKMALLSLDRSIHAQGSWHDVKVSLERATGDTPARCDGASAP